MGPWPGTGGSCGGIEISEASADADEYLGMLLSNSSSGRMD